MHFIYKFFPCLYPPIQESNGVVVNIPVASRNICGYYADSRVLCPWPFEVCRCSLRFPLPRAPLKFYMLSMVLFLLFVCFLSFTIYDFITVKVIWSQWLEAHCLISSGLPARPSKLSIQFNLINWNYPIKGYPLVFGSSSTISIISYI